MLPHLQSSIPGVSFAHQHILNEYISFLLSHAMFPIIISCLLSRDNVKRGDFGHKQTDSIDKNDSTFYC